LSGGVGDNLKPSSTLIEKSMAIICSDHTYSKAHSTIRFQSGNLFLTCEAPPMPTYMHSIYLQGGY